jgi:hypothetical protein
MMSHRMRGGMPRRTWRQFINRTAAVGLAVLAIGCQEHRLTVASPTPASAEATRQGVAYLSVSDAHPHTGEKLVVAARVKVGDSVSVASFKVRLRYDTAALVYLRDFPIPGLLHVANASGGEVTVAGASGDASPDGRLFILQFFVTGRSGLSSLALSIDELNDSAFKSQLATISADARLRVDRGLVASDSGRR